MHMFEPGLGIAIVLGVAGDMQQKIEADSSSMHKS